MYCERHVTGLVTRWDRFICLYQSMKHIVSRLTVGMRARIPASSQRQVCTGRSDSSFPAVLTPDFHDARYLDLCNSSWHGYPTIWYISGPNLTRCTTRDHQLWHLILQGSAISDKDTLCRKMAGAHKIVTYPPDNH